MSRQERLDLSIFQTSDGSWQSISSTQDWLQRREQIQSGMQEVMGPLPGADKRCPFDLEVHETVDCGSYTRQLISYATEPGCRLPAYRLIPKSLQRPAPAALCLHPTDNVYGHQVVVGLGGKPNRQYAHELAELGFVTLAPAYPLLADYQPDLAELGYRSGSMKAIWDNIRSIDLLTAMPEVDPDRIAAIGHSLGGHNAVYTAVFDERIRTVVSSCGLDSFVDYKQGDIRGWTSERYMPSLQAYADNLAAIPFDFPELIACLAPRACLLIAPLGDSNFNWQSVDTIAAVASPVYELHGRESRLQVLHPNCDHDFPPRTRSEAYAFIEAAFQDLPNTQEETVPLLSGEEARERLRLPEGFEATLFASEPMVRQPVAMTFDPRGRLWIAENNTYSDRTQNFDLSLHDQIVIYADRDGDGRADERNVFWDQAQKLTSIEYGFGGVWALCPPNLYFLPDEDRNDVPDGEPVLMLEGFDDSKVRHNFANGLKWGPDGWLYGRHGIQATSIVGTPDTPESLRTPLNCCIWRFHPTTHKFEVVCSGGTNSWGMDWDQHGELFFINTVIGHLWHAIPGAHFERMYGVDFNPYLYELMKQTADHVHWDEATENWTQQKQGVSPGTDRAGGGHAHSGMMIYRGTNWPSEYAHELFTLNFHGRRVNQEHLERLDSTYVGRHRDDFLFSDDVWFRGVELGYGPYGDVFILDWSDIGECHENDGIHRTSGRVFRIRHLGQSEEEMRVTAGLPLQFNLESWSDLRLAEAQAGANEWLARQARRILQERTALAPTSLNQSAIAFLWNLLDSAELESTQLRAFWALDAMGQLNEPGLIELLQSQPGEHLSVWIIRRLMDQGKLSLPATDTLSQLADSNQPGLVNIYLASAMQVMAKERRLDLAQAILTNLPSAVDDRLSLMLWYGIESAISHNPEHSLAFLGDCPDPRLCRFVVRRLLAERPQRNQILAKIVALLKDNNASQPQAILVGMGEASKGWVRQPKPEGWDLVAEAIHSVADAQLRQTIRELSVVFGDGRALTEVAQIISDGRQPAAIRASAIETLANADPSGAVDILSGLVADRDVGPAAIRGLARINPPNLADLLLRRYQQMRRMNKQEAIAALGTTPLQVGALLDAVEAGTVDQADMAPFVLRQLQLLNDSTINRRIAELWPSRALLGEAKLEVIADYQQLLSPSAIAQADPERGKVVFEEKCANCHKLFGDGGELGPELTGSQRGNLNFWLENLVDPSAEVAADFRMSQVLLLNGRVLNGVVTNEFDDRFVLQTPTEELLIQREDVDEILPSMLSLMPEGLLESVAEPADILALFAYLTAGTESEVDESPTTSSERNESTESTAQLRRKHFLYVAEPGIRNYVRFGGHGILVFDIEEDYRFVKRIPMPGLDTDGSPLNVKGICGNAETERLYVSTIKQLICVDLRTDEVVWEREYAKGCDRMSLSPDGKTIYQPSFEKDIWYVLDATSGDEIAQVAPNSRAHNTVIGSSGEFAYLAGLGSNMLTVSDTNRHEIVNQIGPFSDRIRPFTINGSETLCFVNVNNLLGFEVGDLVSGELLHRVEVSGYRQGPVARHGCPSHGIAMTPDETQIWVADGHNECLHVFDVSTLPPTQIDTIELREQPGWITFSLDGQTCWSSTGEIIDVESREIRAELTDEVGRMVMSEKMLEVVFEGQNPIAVGDQFGKGQQHQTDQ